MNGVKTSNMMSRIWKNGGVLVWGHWHRVVNTPLSRNVLRILNEASAASPTETETPSATLRWPNVIATWLSLHCCCGSLLSSLPVLSMLQKLSLLDISPSLLYKRESLRFFLRLKKSISRFFLRLMCFPNAHRALLYNLSLTHQRPRLNHNQGLILTESWSMTLSRRFTFGLINTL